jgi:mono/diheme cytochrome c family protein
MKVDIPYPFTFGSKTLPGGTYTFSFAEDQYMLFVQSSTGQRMTELVMTRISGPGEFLRNGSIVFDRTDGGRTISEIWIPGSDGLLLHATPKSDSREVLLASYLNQNSAVSGEEAYNLTCGKCHGPRGAGNPRADEFFKIAIPRLNSDMVQAKTDAELKLLINKGSTTMPPVEVDEEGFRHRLPPQDVDAVIAYVRTFKE